MDRSAQICRVNKPRICSQGISRIPLRWTRPVRRTDRPTGSNFCVQSIRSTRRLSHLDSLALRLFINVDKSSADCLRLPRSVRHSSALLSDVRTLIRRYSAIFVELGRSLTGSIFLNAVRLQKQFDRSYTVYLFVYSSSTLEFQEECYGNS